MGVEFEGEHAAGPSSDQVEELLEVLRYCYTFLSSGFMHTLLGFVHGFLQNWKFLIAFVCLLHQSKTLTTIRFPIVSWNILLVANAS